MVEHECGDDLYDQCPICLGEVSDEFVAMIEQAAAQPGRPMAFDDAIAWLREFDVTSPPRR